MANKYQIQQLKEDGTLVTLHPETDASIVKVTQTKYGNAQSAIDDFDDRIKANADAIKANADAIEELPDTLVTSVTVGSGAKETGDVTVTKTKLGLGNVDNTSDKAKPISDAQKEVNTAYGNRLTNLETTVGGLSGAMRFLGKTTDSITLTDGYKTQSIQLSTGETVTAQKGDVVLSGKYEFVWIGDQWEQLGQEGSFVLTTQKINNIPLTGDITLTAGNITANRSSGDDTSVSQVLIDLESRFNNYQPTTDNTLTTTSKTVVGAINEVKTTADTANTKATTNATAITNITNGTTKVGKATSADSAGTWTTARTIGVSVGSGTKKDGSTAISGSGSQSINGSANKTISVTLGDSGVVAGLWDTVRVNSKGIVTEGAKLIEIGGTEPSDDLKIGGLFFKAI